jgi:hypothetical protein
MLKSAACENPKKKLEMAHKGDCKKGKKNRIIRGGKPKG